MEICKGLEFSSFAELKERLADYERKNFCKLYIRQSRSIQSAQKRAPRRSYNEDIVLTEVYFNCIHGGKKFKSKGEGRRPKRSTFQKDCPFTIVLKASQDGQKLVIVAMNPEHNHPLSKAIYENLPQVRKLDPKTLKLAQDMLKMNNSKRQVRDYLMRETGKVILLRDLHNAAHPGRKPRPAPMTLLAEMEKEKNATIHVFHDAQKSLKGVYYQSSQMRDLFSAFPEFVMVDVTQGVNNLSMPLYVILVIDGNGQPELAAAWLCKDTDTLREILLLFKQHNTEADKIRCAMTDRDMFGRDVLAEELPDAKLVVCLFDTMKRMRREISVNRLQITQQEREHVLQIVQNLIYSKSEEEYQGHYALLQQYGLHTVMDYFNTNWHSWRNEWVEGLKNEQCYFMNRTKGRLEAIKRRLKSVVSCHSNIVTFWRCFMKCIRSYNIEHNHKVLQLQTKVPAERYTGFELQYFQLLTPCAFEHVAAQIKQSKNVTIYESEDMTYRAVLDSSVHVCDIESCDCAFVKGMSLPCCHIIACRKVLEQDVFDASLCATRWTQEYYLAHHKVFKVEPESDTNDEVEERTMSIDSTPTKLSADTSVLAELRQTPKCKKARDLTQQIASIISGFDSQKFDKSIKLLEQVKRHFETEQEFLVVPTVRAPVTEASSAIMVMFEHDYSGGRPTARTVSREPTYREGNTSYANASHEHDSEAQYMDDEEATIVTGI